MSQVVSFADYTPAARFDSVPWTSVRVEESATSSGPWTVIDTLTLTPADSNPAAPQTRNLTTENGSDTPDLWYRLTFLDGTGGTGQPSTPVQNAAPATTFATTDDLAARLGIELTADEVTRANRLLADASTLIQDETGQTIDMVTDDVYTRPGTYDNRILLPQRPVATISTVAARLVGGPDFQIGTDSWYRDGDELVRAAFPVGIQRHFFQTGNGWLGPTFTLAITYTHGYTDVPAIAKTVCLEAVVRVWVNPGVVREEAYGSNQITYAKSGGMILTDDERHQLNNYFRRTSGSFALR